jgi:hypothetical protein
MKTSTRIYRDADLLTWIGEGAYSTVDEFIKEAGLLGCSRRLPGLLSWSVPGRTRVFLVHRNGSQDPAYGSIFAFFTINSLHVIYDDITYGNDPEQWHLELRPGVEPPQDEAEFEEYLITHKFTITHRKAPETASDPISELLAELLKEWMKEAIKNTIENGVRHIPWSREADNLERLCGGVSSLGSGRYPGVYASDELGDWILDQVLDLLLEEEEPPDYFWEEVVEKTTVVRKRRRHKRAPMGHSRSRRISLEQIHGRSGQPPQDTARITVFREPYPLYYHPPKAPFRGFRRIDGDALLLKVGRPQYRLKP